MKKKGSFWTTVETERIEESIKVPITIEESKPYVNATTVINSAFVPVPVKLLIDVGNSDAIWLSRCF
jgi:hypothetical protein